MREGGHKFGKMGRRCLWMAPNLNSKSFQKLQFLLLHLQSMGCTVVGLTKNGSIKPFSALLDVSNSATYCLFWQRFHIVVLGMIFFFTSHLLFPFSFWTFISLFSLEFYFPILFGLLIPFSIWTFISLFYLDFYFPFLFGLFFLNSF